MELTTFTCSSRLTKTQISTYALFLSSTMYSQLSSVDGEETSDVEKREANSVYFPPSRYMLMPFVRGLSLGFNSVFSRREVHLYQRTVRKMFSSWGTHQYLPGFGSIRKFIRQHVFSQQYAALLVLGASSTRTRSFVLVRLPIRPVKLTQGGLSGAIQGFRSVCC